MRDEAFSCVPQAPSLVPDSLFFSVPNPYLAESINVDLLVPKVGSQLGGLGGGTEGEKIVLEGAVGRQHSSSFPVLCCRDTHTVRACPLVGMFSRLRSEPQE